MAAESPERSVSPPKPITQKTNSGVKKSPAPIEKKSGLRGWSASENKVNNTTIYGLSVAAASPPNES